MDTLAAARRWAETWSRAWPLGDVEALAALYANGAAYRALAFREPTSARRYLEETLAAETDVECRFAEPVVAGDRAVVEWRASWLEAGAAITLAGATVLRFDPDGRVVDHRDYWNELPGRVPPYAGWG